MTLAPSREDVCGHLSINTHIMIAPYWTALALLLSVPLIYNWALAGKSNQHLNLHPMTPAWSHKFAHYHLSGDTDIEIVTSLKIIAPYIDCIPEQQVRSR